MKVISSERKLMNKDQTRAILDCVFGVACYIGKTENNEFKGIHQGIAESWEQAVKWLDGDETIELRKVYPELKK